MPSCQSVDISFLNTAKVKVINTVEIKASAEEIFATFEDPDAWPLWFKGINKVIWTSEKPYRVNTTRTVLLGPLKIWEHFFIWEQNQRFAFFFTKTNLPFVKALLEDYQLEKIDESTTRFTYTVAYDPSFILALTGPIGRAALKANFTKAAKSLVRYMENKR